MPSRININSEAHVRFRYIRISGFFFLFMACFRICEIANKFMRSRCRIFSVRSYTYVYEFGANIYMYVYTTYIRTHIYTHTRTKTL